MVMMQKNGYKVKIIDYKTAIDFLLPRHYSGRTPSVSLSFGWYDNNDKLISVCTFGKPASPSLCKGVCGDDNSQYVYELNRLLKLDIKTPPLSSFVSACLKYIKINKQWIIVSYSDMAMNHNGYIYQACNFLYTGKTKQRTDKYTKGNKHSRHYDKNEKEVYRKVRSSKHRYIYLCTNNKKQYKEWLDNLNYDIQDYPKGENSKYVLGDFLEPKIIKVN